MIAFWQCLLAFDTPPLTVQTASPRLRVSFSWGRSVPNGLGQCLSRGRVGTGRGLCGWYGRRRETSTMRHNVVFALQLCCLLFSSHLFDNTLCRIADDIRSGKVAGAKFRSASSSRCASRTSATSIASLLLTRLAVRSEQYCTAVGVANHFQAVDLVGYDGTIVSLKQGCIAKTHGQNVVSIAPGAERTNWDSEPIEYRIVSEICSGQTQAGNRASALGNDQALP